MAKRTLELTEVADIRCVSVLAEQLRTLAAVAEPVVVDARAVGRADASTLQALAAFVRERRPRGLEVQWQPSEAFLESARSLGLAETLGLEASVQPAPN